MDNTTVDKLTKDILVNSKLELTNPDFNSLLMNKIRFESQKQSILQNIGWFFLTFLSLDAIIFALLKLMHIRTLDIIPKVTAFTNGILSNIQNSPSNIGQFLLIYFLILAIVFFGLNIVSSSRSRYSGI